ncbi:MAG: sulfatase-like hydrolase/transferase [Candidatus Nealsonbacteria bacterium]|nr:sulfatase-like hydrolase/transferase [Candidatus Nealsonbacteria bacterium]
MRLHFYHWLLAVATVACPLAAAEQAEPEQPDRPNVLLIFTDDQGTLDTNAYGSTDLYTPHMDRLAKEGVRFTQAYSHTVCCPARALLMTGRHPQRSGVVNWTQGDLKAAKGINMALEEVTLAESLKKAGYATALFGKWHLGAHKDYGPTKQGFDVFFGLRGGFIDNNNHFFLHGNGNHDLYEGTREVFHRDEYFPDLMTDRAIEWIRQNKARPWFCYYAMNIPHYPEQADAKFDRRYADLEMPRQSYAKMISTTDDRIGRVLARLDELKIRDRTIVVFMSDNGASAETAAIRVDNHASGLPKGHNYGANGGGGNTGKWRGHKGTYLEGGLRVPAIISYPAKLPVGAVRDQAIIAADWYPTILELCGVEQPGVKLDGASVLPLIEDARRPTHHEELHWAWGAGWAVRVGDWKLIGARDQPKSLVNLSDESPEATNHLKAQPDVAQSLHARHKEWLSEVLPPVE